MKCYNNITFKEESRLVKMAFLGIFLVMLFTSSTFAQTNFGVKAPFKTISFGQKIDLGDLDNSVSWIVSNKSGATVPAYLKGNEINNYVFEKPGSYEVRFSETKPHNQECYHPAFDDTFLIAVSPLKMTFDFSKISFSETIQGGRNCDGIILSVPVNVTLLEGASSKFVVPDVYVAGVGSQITATPIQKEITLKQGTQMLKYNLTGVATSETYLMFDFVDANNQIQTYNLPQIIK